MNADGHIYEIPADMKVEPAVATDAARLDGYLRGRAEADVLKLAETVRQFKEQDRERES